MRLSVCESSSLHRVQSRDALRAKAPVNQACLFMALG
jgi:hypothetical protein